eukprot:5975776-Prymnesium_polylepis.1
MRSSSGSDGCCATPVRTPSKAGESPIKRSPRRWNTSLRCKSSKCEPMCAGLGRTAMSDGASECPKRKAAVANSLSTDGERSAR